MRKLHLLFAPILFLTIMSCLPSCKKDKPQKLYSNITLYDKPLPVIRAHIQGKWKLSYARGGIMSNNVQYFDDIFWEFGNNSNTIKQFYNDSITLYTIIYWYKDIGTYTNGDKTLIMKFYGQYEYPNVYVVERIVNDTLIIHDNSFDAVFYHFIRF